MQFFKSVKCEKSFSQTVENLKEAIKSYNVVHLADYCIDMPYEEFYQELAKIIGVPYSADEDIVTGERLDNQWIDISYDPNIQDRYRSSNTRQPLHTDDSYVELNGKLAINFFYCKSKAAIGGATTFLSIEQLIECMQLDNQQELMDRLFSTVVNFEKSGSKKVRKILDKDEYGYLANWNYYCIDSNNTPEALQLVEDFHQYLETRVFPAGIVTALQLQKEECVFFHDDRILHGRNAYFATHKGERCLIKGKIILESNMITA